MSREPLTDSMLLSTAASVLVAAAARLQDLSVALERGNATRELARQADHAAKLATIALRDVAKLTRKMAATRRRPKA